MTRAEVSEGELLLKFARELKEIVESFEEEAEILANSEIFEEIKRNEERYRAGDFERFEDISKLRERLGI